MRADVRRPWTRDELILAINFYCKTTFGRMHSRNPEIIGLARRLGRTPGAVSYKLANFSSLDPTLDRKGAANVSRLDREVWDEFFTDWDRMFAESELRMAEFLAQGEDDGTRRRPGGSGGCRDGTHRAIRDPDEARSLSAASSCPPTTAPVASPDSPVLRFWLPATSSLGRRTRGIASTR